jgi:aryl-alcohol dehydrogenase-like predicted oxidoreductase
MSLSLTLNAGTWAWGSRSGPWKEDPDGENNVRSAWEACNNVGLTFYDTAYVY